MSVTTANNLFIVPSRLEFYQQLLKGLASREALGRRALEEIKLAQAFRQVDKVRELALVLLHSPVREHRVIGEYYGAWCGCREKRYDTQLVESVIDRTTTYKAQALLSRAAMEGSQDNIEQELYFYTEAFKNASTLSHHIEASRGIAVAKAKEGFHRAALNDLERLIPFLRHADPLVYYDVLNSYAVELGQAGRVGEARAVSGIVLASPFAPAYPEWQDTALAVRKSRRSFLAVNPLRGTNVLRFTPHSTPSQPEASQPAKVLSLSKRLEKRLREVKRKAEKAFKIRTSILNDDLPEHVLDDILRLLGKDL